MEVLPILEAGDRLRPNLWYVLGALGTSPAARVGHAAVLIAAGDGMAGIYVIGGANPDGPFSDVHRLDTRYFKWEKVSIKSDFTARYEHSAFVPIAKPKSVYIFGGALQTGNLNSIEILDTEVGLWSAPCVSGTPPSPRTHHTAASVGNDLYVFGGGQTGADPVPDIQIHAFDAGSHEWRQPECRGTAPSPRHGHIMAAIGSLIIVHGGMAASTFYDDLFTFKTDTMVWDRPSVAGSVPSGRTAHSSAVHGKKLFVFGGMNMSGALNDLYVLNTESYLWARIECEGPPPAPRLDHTLCVVNIPVFCESMLTETSAGESKATPAIRSDKLEVVQNEPVDTTLSPQLVTVLSPDMVAVGIDNKDASRKDRPGTPRPTVAGYQTVLMVICGMDTQGTIFDDCLVFPIVESL